MSDGGTIRDPGAAAAEARRRAAARPAHEQAQSTRIRVGPPAPEASEMKLYQWALIEPDTSHVRSTRRLGAPITAVKRLLLRLLVQYHIQLLGEQTRFNIALVGYVRRLETRIEQLEAQLEGRSEGQPETQPGDPRGDETA